MIETGSRSKDISKYSVFAFNNGIRIINSNFFLSSGIFSHVAPRASTYSRGALLYERQSKVCSWRLKGLVTSFESALASLKSLFSLQSPLNCKSFITEIFQLNSIILFKQNNIKCSSFTGLRQLNKGHWFAFSYKFLLSLNPPQVWESSFYAFTKCIRVNTLP